MNEKTKMYSLNFEQGHKILEIGGGDNPLRSQDGKRVTINMDMQSTPNVDINHDMSVFPWPIEDCSYKNVFGRYCLEHISWHDVEKAISEIYRIMSYGGQGVFFVPNTFEQCKVVAEKGIDVGSVEMLFGSQEFIPRHLGAHKMGFSPRYAVEIFKKAGFNEVKIVPHPVSATDMIIEAYKMKDENIFEREYFEDGTIGYHMYRDFTVHNATAKKIMDMKPESVLDIGCARGYVVRILENNGVAVKGLDISRHCYMTRASDNVIQHDVTDIPWHKAKVFKDKQFDLCFSQNVLEHLHEDKIDGVIREIARVSKRGFHGIHYTDSPYEESKDIDVTHCTMHTKQWWVDKFNELAPGYNVVIDYPRTIENDDPEKCIAYPPETSDSLVKLNLGCFQDMFYHGWINIDIINLEQFAKSQGYLFQPADVTKGLGYADGGCDIIFSSHLLEHLTREEGKNFLKECYRVLKPGGIIRISTPNAMTLSIEYINDGIWQNKYINVGVEKAEDSAEAYHNLLMAGHKTLYDEPSLRGMLERAGFVNIEKASPFNSRSDAIRCQTINNHPDISIIMEAEKP